MVQTGKSFCTADVEEATQSNNELFRLFYFFFFNAGVPTIGKINILRSIKENLLSTGVLVLIE